jgi:mannose-6-phosphate isomerase-like protein (cupin superfamily)
MANSVGSIDTSSTAAIEPVNLADMFAKFDEPWSPKIVGEVNDTALKVVKLEGAFLWHQHANADELFFVVAGSFTMRLRDRDVIVGEREFIIVPKGVEHMPVADQRCHVLLIEPGGLVNTGDVQSERTADPSQSL